MGHLTIYKELRPILSRFFLKALDCVSNKEVSVVKLKGIILLTQGYKYNSLKNKL